MEVRLSHIYIIFIYKNIALKKIKEKPSNTSHDLSDMEVNKKRRNRKEQHEINEGKSNLLLTM